MATLALRPLAHARERKVFAQLATQLFWRLLSAPRGGTARPFLCFTDQ